MSIHKRTEEEERARRAARSSQAKGEPSVQPQNSGGRTPLTRRPDAQPTAWAASPSVNLPKWTDVSEQWQGETRRNQPGQGSGNVGSGRYKFSGGRETAKQTTFSPLKLGAGMVAQGATSAAKGVSGTLSFLEGAVTKPVDQLLGADGEFVKTGAFYKLNEDIRGEQEAAHRMFQPNVEAGGTPAKIADFLGTTTIAAIPQAVVALATGGGEQGIEAVSKAAQTAPGVLASIKSVAGSLPKNPAYWSSMFQTIGNDYEEAKSGGADEKSAVLYALADGIGNAGIEVGGGLETMAAQRFGLKQWLKTAMEEGNEEVAQGIVQRGLQNLAYNKENPLYSVTDENAVVNPMTALQEWSGGAFAGGLLGGVQGVTGNLLNDRYAARAYDAGDLVNAPQTAGSPLERAAQDMADGKPVSNRTASSILENPGAVKTLEQDAGLSIRDDMSKSRRRAAVKSAVEALASRPNDGSASAGEFTQADGNGAQAEQKRAAAPARPAAQQAYDIGRVQRAASSLGKNGEKALTAAYNGEGSADSFYAGFASYYEAGVSGMDMERVQSEYGGQLNSAQRYAAYVAGQNDATASLETEKRAAQFASVAGTESGLVYDDFVREAIESGRTIKNTSGQEAAYLTNESYTRLNAVAKLLGTRVRFVDSVRGGTANAKIEGYEVEIEKNNGNPVTFLLGHEWTHRMQELAPAEYRAFRDFVAAQPGSGYKTQALSEYYRAQGESIDYEAALDELAADYAGQMIADGKVLDDFIAKHSQDPTLLEMVRDAIRTLVRKLTGAERRQAETAEGKLTKALEAAERQAKVLTAQKNTATEGGEGKYSIKYDWNNTPYVVIGADILDGVPKNRWVKTVKDNLREKFPDGVSVGNNVISINKQSRMEMTFSKYMQRIMKQEPNLYADKLRATTNADEILQASRNWVNEALLHPRQDAIIDFARGEVLLRIGENDYSAQVIVGNRGDSGLLLYDIINLNPASIQERTKKSGAEFTDQPHKAGRTVDSSTPAQSAAPASDANSVPQNGEKSNTDVSKERQAPSRKYMQNAGKNAVQQRDTSGTMETVKYSVKGEEQDGREGETDRGAIESFQNETGADGAGPEESEGVRRELPSAAGRYAGVDHSFGQKPVHAWVESGAIVPKDGSVAQAEQVVASEYRIASFVVSDDVWEKNHPSAPAFAANGQIFMRETIPARYRGMFTTHEATHVMKQARFQPYLDFVARTPNMLNMADKMTQVLLNHVAEHQHTSLVEADPTRLYDEFNATMYGHIAAGKADMFSGDGMGAHVFHDFDAYAAELTAIHEQFKKRRAEGKPGAFSLKGAEQLTREIDRLMRDAQKTGRSEDEVRGEIKALVQQVYLDQLEQYGAIKAGEKPVREVHVPKKTAQDRKVSQTVRTILEAGATPDIAIPNIEELTAKGEFSYEVYTDKQAMADAEAYIVHEGWDDALNDWRETVSHDEVSKRSTAIGWALYNNAANSGNVSTAMNILDLMVKHQRNAAQAVQATRILKQLSPEAQLYGVQRSVDGLQRDLNQRYGDKKGPELKISEELAKKLLEAHNEKARDEALKEIYRDIGRQMPSRFMDKWNAWRYLAMLGNPRTHVRNIVGNAGFVPVVAAKDWTATAIEAAVNRVSGGKLERSKGAVGLGQGDRALLAAAWKDFAAVQEAAMSGGKYDDLANSNKYIEEGRVIFQPGAIARHIPGASTAMKGMEAAGKGNSRALDTEDQWFSKPHYAYAMAQYCKANHITAEQIGKGDPLSLAKARAYAVKEAQKATYRDTNVFSQAASEWGRTVRAGKNPVRKGVGVVMEGILPFRKTPANILVRGLEYSPAGLLKGLIYDLQKVRRGEMTGAEAIDHISAGLTGTGLLALGIYLAAQGLIRGHGGGDDDKRKFLELQGHQAYALELPDGTSVTLDWLAPEALSFFVGVNLWEQTAGGKAPLTLSEALTAMATVSEPLLEMSCLQSLNDVFDAVGYASSDGLDGLPAALASASTSYLTQCLPTILGQAERTGEAERMTTYTEKNAFLTSDMQYTLGRASARIPGLEYNQIPYIDAWGRTERSGSAGGRAANNFLNPAYTSTVETSHMEKELLRLYEATGDDRVLPSRAGKGFTVGGERKNLGAAEYVTYAKLKGQKSYELVTALTESSLYREMDDGENVKAVVEAYDLANQQAKAAISDYGTESWMQKAAEAEKLYQIKPETYIALKMQTAGIDSLKYKDKTDKNGKPVTIPDSTGLLIMEQVYSISGLSDRQRQAMFEYLGVGKNVRHWNKTLVRGKLTEMRKQSG